jgi:hypothetical protein
MGFRNVRWAIYLRTPYTTVLGMAWLDVSPYGGVDKIGKVLGCACFFMTLFFRSL